MTASGALAIGVIVAAVGPARASAIACGSTITASVRLTEDLNCTADTTGSGITIGADGVTVNLNGYQILGPGDLAGTYGIADTGYSDVTIEYGAMSNFGTDVDLMGASGSELTGIVVRHLTIANTGVQDGFGVYGEHLSGTIIHRLSISNAYVGVELVSCQHSAVTHNYLQDPFYGGYDGTGTANRWAHNTLSDVTYQGIVAASTADAVIRDNTVNGAGAYGIEDQGSDGVTIAQNVLNDLYDGVYDFASSDGNISYNTGSGDTYGIDTYALTGYAYAGNTFENGQYGIETDLPTSEILSGNVTSNNSEAGLFVYTGGAAGWSAMLSYNTGNDNSFGLYSQIPTSGTGNRASGNMKVNCYNVTCVTSAAAAGRVRSPAYRPPAAMAIPAPRARH
jgi:hypothetical protein